MHLAHLPNETLLAIVSFLRRQRDLYALVRTNRRLYYLLRDVLYDYNCRYYHASALIFVAIRGDLYLAGRLFDELKPLNSDVNSGSDSELIDSAESPDSDDEDMVQMFSFADIARHPSRAARYSTTDIVMNKKALLAGIQAGQKDMVALLLDHGAQPNFYRDVPPLFLAVQCGNEELVECLLSRGSEPDRNNSSPLYRAVADGRKDIVLMLMQGGAANVESSLKLAAQRGDQSMMEFMLGHGARADLCGAAAHHVALRKGDDDMVCLLKSKGAPAYYLWEPKDDWDEEEGDGAKRELKLYGCGRGMPQF
ncbi:ankyrin repeat-containing protein [Aspergillus welwitschiae]|uniref:Ankyrin repeat-containing protein n=1 Tax=Aspergillus welwitschiae TaxID=1341132 RepID=A0A3F3Q3X6_9EURO|nr:ankyrin repeat-containing protein [Aspergillus welwitschiae]RDH33883.1 ankyrin repeat-containing protein [Aspergillus welwitschiae]